MLLMMLKETLPVLHKEQESVTLFEKGVKLKLGLLLMKWQETKTRRYKARSLP